ncbi:hypothetical protein C8J57DRAFT_1512596 [Mycena rebaudengoi]|nr:hypothetical protein C8J57DRAFT_1512596 [Mycena rebaudengoi]
MDAYHHVYTLFSFHHPGSPSSSSSGMLIKRAWATPPSGSSTQIAISHGARSLAAASTSLAKTSPPALAAPNANYGLLASLTKAPILDLQWSLVSPSLYAVSAHRARGANLNPGGCSSAIFGAFRAAFLNGFFRASMPFFEGWPAVFQAASCRGRSTALPPAIHPRHLY